MLFSVKHNGDSLYVFLPKVIVVGKSYIHYDTQKDKFYDFGKGFILDEYGVALVKKNMCENRKPMGENNQC